MPKISSIRFQKLDDYQNFVMIANADKEPKQYKKLSRFYKQLSEEHKDSFLPLYENTKFKYATLRLKKNIMLSKLKLNPNDTIDLKFTVRRTTHLDKVFINCHVESVKLVERAPPVELGDVLNLSDSDDSP